jgi:hypothetical protein
MAIREYAGRRGFALAGEYVDIGISGAKDHRTVPCRDPLYAVVRRTYAWYRSGRTLPAKT